MSFHAITCWNCRQTNTFYQERSLIPPCPICGAGANGDSPVQKKELEEVLWDYPEQIFGHLNEY